MKNLMLLAVLVALPTGSILAQEPNRSRVLDRPVVTVTVYDYGPDGSYRGSRIVTGTSKEPYNSIESQQPQPVRGWMGWKVWVVTGRGLNDGKEDRHREARARTSVLGPTVTGRDTRTLLGGTTPVGAGTTGLAVRHGRRTCKAHTTLVATTVATATATEPLPLFLPANRQHSS